MTATELKNKIKSGALAGWYILAGEEDYLKKHYLSEIRSHVLTCEGFEMFNHALFEGADMELGTLKEALSAPPMMSEYKLVEWKYANLDAMKESERSTLLDIAEQREDYPEVIFVIMTSSDGFDLGRPNKPSRLAKSLSEHFDIINFEKSTDAQLLGWMKKHFDAEGVSVDAPTLQAMLFRVGRSMESLNNEINKLCAYVKQNRRESAVLDDVELICSANTESDAFALGNAVIEKNAKAAFIALDDLKSRRVDPSQTVAMLERVYCDLVSVSLLIDEGKNGADIERVMKFHPYKTKLYMASVKKTSTRALADALSKLGQLDAASKSGGLTGYTAIEIFITQNI